MSDINLHSSPCRMLELGLAALSHAVRHSAYVDYEANSRWEDLSVLQAAHAAEILFKSRIAQEHPLLIFDTFPKTSDALLTTELLFEKGRTIDWSDIPNTLWATTGIQISNLDIFKKFGALRNGIQHFGVVPKGIDLSLETLKFIFSVVDPFINKCWGVYAVDCDEDYDSSEHLPGILLRQEILFLPSPQILSSKDYWDVDWDLLDSDYKKEILKRISILEINTKKQEVSNK